MDNTKELRCLSFCSGYGGIERGIELTGTRIRTVAYVEIEAFPIANMVAKMEQGEMVPAPVWTNLKTLPMEEFRGSVDILTGGFPCQPFSSAGQRCADEDQRHLFPFFKRAIGEIKPKYVFLENVDGIASARLSGTGWTDEPGTPVLLHVLRELERMGYRAKAGQYSASSVGAPHGRKRWFIYGELGNSESLQCNGCESELFWKPKVKESEFGNSNRKPREKELGDPKHNGPHGAEKSGSIEKTVRNDTKRPINASELERTSKPRSFRDLFRWPARPGREQFVWEEPRTISNTEDSRCRGRQNNTNGKNTSGIQEQESKIKSMVRSEVEGCHRNGATEEHQTKSKLGRTTNGTASWINPTANRVDRLRMCGNGVVPHSAALAWVDLHF